ncbi:MAG: response regulator [Burkholderiaceae bacterium]|nr:response regulator [Burkholderiaceae bacterium]
MLYIEDNPSNVALVRGIFELRPALSLLVASDGISGLAIARERRPDLVLLDLSLPDIDGLSVFERLRRARPTASMRCVALSADATAARIEEIRAKGFIDYWTKPIDVTRFLSDLDRLLAGHARPDARRPPVGKPASGGSDGDDRALGSRMLEGLYGGGRDLLAQPLVGRVRLVPAVPDEVDMHDRHVEWQRPDGQLVGDAGRGDESLGQHRQQIGLATTWPAVKNWLTVRHDAPLALDRASAWSTKPKAGRKTHQQVMGVAIPVRVSSARQRMAGASRKRSAIVQPFVTDRRRAGLLHAALRNFRHHHRKMADRGVEFVGLERPADREW